MNKVLLAAKSRTVWTLIVMVLVNVIPGLPFDQSVKDLINGILTLLATFFHLNPSQQYSVPNGTEMPPQ